MFDANIRESEGNNSVLHLMLGYTAVNVVDQISTMK